MVVRAPRGEFRDREVEVVKGRKRRVRKAGMVAIVRRVRVIVRSVRGVSVRDSLDG